MRRNSLDLKEEYWNIDVILRFQRRFNLINSERSIGKTYTTQKRIIEKCLKSGRQFAFIVRTQDEKKKGAFKQAFEKVEAKEFQKHEFAWDTECLSINGEIVGWCFALSESQKLKKRSFPNIDWFIFDEYMIEQGSSASYVKGFNEPDLFLSIYHTVDRDEDRVICFLLGNNTTFYNPYHLHPAFNVQPVKRGEIWKSKNVLYQWAEATPWVKAKKKESLFGQMIAGSDYGNFANLGTYIEDEESFIDVHDGKAKYFFTMTCNSIDFGIWADLTKGLIYVSEKIDPSCPVKYALTLEDQTENTLVTKIKTVHIDRFTKAVKLGLLRYESMMIKKVCEKAIYKLL